jgi:serine/threonine-protein kinase
VERCLAKNPADRYPNTRDLAAQLCQIKELLQSTEAPMVTRIGAGGLTRRRAMWLGGVAAVTAAAAISAWKLLPGDSRIRSIAVLPFENAATDADAEFLCYGLTNSLVRKMAGLPSLIVKRGTVSSNQEKRADPQTVGQQLGVDAIITGSVLQRSGKLYVTAELVDVTTGAIMWADKYDKDEADMALIQDEIASAIVEDGIRLKLSEDDRRRLIQHVTGDPEAYKLYMRAVYLHSKENEADYLTARELLQQAVGKDKRFALAYTQLAWNYASMAVDGYEPPAQNFPLVEQYARQALDLNPDLLEAHNGLGASAFWYRWDWESAQIEFEMDARSPTSMHSAYTLALWAVGCAEEALRVVRRDLDRNPLNLELRLREADLLLYVRQTETAVSLYANITRDEPSDARAYFGLAQAMLAQERFDESITHLRRGYEIASVNNLPLDIALAKLLESAMGAEGYRQVE